MIIKIKRIDKSLPLPEYKSSGAAAFDLYARKKMTIPSHGWVKIPSNVIINIPEDHGLF